MWGFSPRVVSERLHHRRCGHYRQRISLSDRGSEQITPPLISSGGGGGGGDLPNFSVTGIISQTRLTLPRQHLNNSIKSLIL